MVRPDRRDDGIVDQRGGIGIGFIRAQIIGHACAYDADGSHAEPDPHHGFSAVQGVEFVLQLGACRTKIGIWCDRNGGSTRIRSSVIAFVVTHAWVTLGYGRDLGRDGVGIVGFGFG